MSELKDEVTEKFVTQSGYTLKECVDAYEDVSIQGWLKLKNAEEETVHKAMPYAWYVGLRCIHFQIEFTVIAIVTAVFSLLSLAVEGAFQVSSSFFSFSSTMLAAFVSAFWLKYESSTYSRWKSVFGFRIVDKTGSPISNRQAIIRAAVFAFTWFLFPLHLICVATHSRRFIHDYASGSYVLVGKENLQTSFYPRSKPWMAVVLLVLCLFVVRIKFFNLPPSFQQAGTICAEHFFDVDSRLWLVWLEWQYADLVVDYVRATPEDARHYISIYDKLLKLRTKYYGPEDSQSKLYKLSIDMLRNKAGR